MVQQRSISTPVSESMCIHISTKNKKQTMMEHWGGADDWTGWLDFRFVDINRPRSGSGSLESPLPPLGGVAIAFDGGSDSARI